MFNIKDDLEEDFSFTIWGKVLLDELLQKIDDNVNKLEYIRNKLKLYTELEKYVNTISQDIEKLKQIKNQIILNEIKTWDYVSKLLIELQFEKWPIDRKVELEYKDEAKKIRDEVKKDITSIMQKIFIISSKQANKDIYAMYSRLVAIKNLILEFEEKFAEKKKEKNIIDFHDIEHFALEILLKQDENRNVIPTEIAKRISEKYEEIAIDEYQDSNLVQEYILNSISRENNLFMVGDVKQSIYKFRQAMPELFIEKYTNYLSVNEGYKGNSGKKIKLFKNFRSRENVLQITNAVFEEIMSKQLGDIDYNKDEYLNLGANYPEIEDNKNKAELLVVDLNKDEIIEDEEESEDIIEKNILEARLVVKRIKELLDNNYMVYDKGKYRKITYRDIAILLRTTNNIAPVFERELLDAGFPVFCDTTAEYLDSIEIQTIMSVLKILDNPMQDIPLICVLRSPIGNFTDNDLVEIRLQDRKSNFYVCMQKARVGAKEELRKKIDIFFNYIERWKKYIKEKPLNELIWQIYIETNYYYYVGLLTNGKLRQANLKMLFERAKQYESASFKGLYNFINFIDKLKTNSGDLSAAKII